MTTSGDPSPDGASPDGDSSGGDLPEDAPEDEMAIAMASVTNPSGYRGEVRTGRHRFVVDESAAVGGHDAGPNPYQLVLAGLVQCTAATLRMYAARKQWPLGAVKVRARLLRTGEGAAKSERIERTVTLGGDLSAEQVERLAEIADRTPVTRTLQKGWTIDTTLRREGQKGGPPTDRR